MPFPDASTDTLLRPFTAADVVATQALTAAFGWPHRVEDWAFMSRFGHGVVAERGGGVVGCAMAWLHGAEHATLGLVGVSPTLQGGGLGRRLMQTLLADLDGRAVVLHATAAGLSLYRSVGFVDAGMIRQQQGVVAERNLPASAGEDDLDVVTGGDLDAVAALDRAATGLDRPLLVAALVGESVGVVARAAGTPVGYALMRRFGRGHVIGPVAAADGATARALIVRLMRLRAGGFVRLDVPDESGLSPWLEGLGLGDAGPSVRMTRGAAPPRPAPAPAPASFVISSPALG